MRGAVDPALRCRTAKLSRALQPGEGNGLAGFAAEIEYGASSRNCSGGLPALGRRTGTSSALLRQSTGSVANGLFACPAHGTATLNCRGFLFIEAGQTIRNQYIF